MSGSSNSRTKVTASESLSKAALSPLLKVERRCLADINELKHELTALKADIDWLAKFDRERADDDIESANRHLQEIGEQLRCSLAQLKKLSSKTPDLERAARAGLNLRQWLSPEIREAKMSLRLHQSELDARERECNDARRAKRREQSRLKKLQAELSRADKISSGDILARKKVVDTELALHEAELKRIRARRAVAEEGIAPLLVQLQAHHREVKRLRTRIEVAQSLEDELSEAHNSYERAMIHEECQEELGQSSPRQVIKEAQRLIAAETRTIGKVEKRIDETVRRASLDVRAVMIDGNNLCYERGRFIGLRALIPVTVELMKKSQVSVVFDASIRRLLSQSDGEIRRQFPSAVKVHVMSSRGEADETVLAVSQDSGTYVLSNDRYAEYQDSDVVRSNRLITHEITGGKVFVHDLSVACNLEQ